MKLTLKPQISHLNCICWSWISRFGSLVENAYVLWKFIGINWVMNNFMFDYLVGLSVIGELVLFCLFEDKQWLKFGGVNTWEF